MTALIIAIIDEWLSFLFDLKRYFRSFSAIVLTMKLFKFLFEKLEALEIVSSGDYFFRNFSPVFFHEWSSGHFCVIDIWSYGDLFWKVRKRFASQQWNFFSNYILSCGESGCNYREAHACWRFVLILSGNKPFNRIATPDINYGAAEGARVAGREKNKTRYTFFGGARASLANASK